MALKEEKENVISGKKKGLFSKGDQCSFRHESNDRARKPTPKAATSSEPSMTRGRSARKRSVRGESNPGIILRQPRKYFLKGTCARGRSASRKENLRGRVHLGSSLDSRAKITLNVLAQNRLVSIGILTNVNSIKTESGCKAGDKCLFPRHKVDEQLNKKLQKSYFPTTCTTIGLCHKIQNALVSLE